MHDPAMKANVAAPPANPSRQLGKGPRVRGALAELVRSNIKPPNVTEKEVKVMVSGSYVNDPAVGLVPAPVKLSVYVVKSIELAMASGAAKVTARKMLKATNVSDLRISVGLLAGWYEDRTSIYSIHQNRHPVEQIPEPTYVEAFIAQSAMEAFYVRVRPW